MNDFDAVSRLNAWFDGRPLPIGQTVPWARVAPAETLVVAFVRMAGETSPWAIAWGTPDGEVHLESVPDPRRPNDVRAMAMRFGRDLLAHCGHPSYGSAIDVANAAIVLPGASHIEMLHYLEYRYSRAQKLPEAERGEVNAVGRLCGWIFREANRPSQSLVVDPTRCLREAWAFASEDLRQQHLGYLLGWLETQGDRDARSAAAETAEASAVGITLDPTLERDELEPLVSAWNHNRQEGTVDSTSALKIRAVVESEVLRRWKIAVAGWNALQSDSRKTSRALAVMAPLAQEEYQREWRTAEARLLEGDEIFVADPETDRVPQAAASRFFAHQYSSELGASARLHDDRDRVAQAVLGGDATLGTITQVRDEGTGRTTIPVWTIEAPLDAPTRFREGTEVEVAGSPGRTGVLRSITAVGDRRVLELEVRGQKTDRGGYVHAADAGFVGETVALFGSNMADLTKLKSMRVWKADSPGAWLTHGQSTPPQDRTTRRQEDLVDFVESLGGSR